MKKLLLILSVVAATLLATSCQKDLPASMSNVVISKGGSSSTTNPTPVDPTQQGDIPAEGDNPMPNY